MVGYSWLQVPLSNYIAYGFLSSFWFFCTIRFSEFLWFGRKEWERNFFSIRVAEIGFNIFGNGSVHGMNFQGIKGTRLNIFWDYLEPSKEFLESLSHPVKVFKISLDVFSHWMILGFLGFLGKRLKFFGMFFVLRKDFQASWESD